jgi:hypothetical protein
VDPLLSVLIGVLVYHERLHRGPYGGVLVFALLLLLVSAVIQLGRIETEELPVDEDAARRPVGPRSGG